MTSENEFITVYAGLIISAEGLSERPSTQEMIITGRMKRVAVANVQYGVMG